MPVCLRHRRILLAVLAALALAAAACGSSTPSASNTPSGASDRTANPSVSGSARGSITVFAAASLTESFTRIGEEFEAANPDATVTFNFAGSSALAAQLVQGAPADVFASADDANMNKLLQAAGVEGEPVTFARNELAIIVSPGNPHHIESLEDLSDPDLLVVLCGPQVPIGAYSAQVLAKAAVTVTPKSLEADVKSVVTKVIAGEADAGIVYATDVRAAGERAELVTIPERLNVVARYPIAVIRDAPNVTAAKKFVDHVTGTSGQATLRTFGFTAP